MSRNDNRGKIAVVVALTAAFTALRLAIDEPGPLYLAPVLLAGLWFGPRAGLVTGTVCALLYVGTSELRADHSLGSTLVAFALRVAIYGTGGWIVGTLAESRERLSIALGERDLELRELRSIQEALAPAEPPDRPGLELAACYVPAEHGVSGDFYVVTPVGDGATLVAVGDVAGSGLEAAKRSWYVRTLPSSSADVTDDPTTILEQVNRAFVEDAGFASPFVTAACLVYRPEGRVEWALAGHDRPIRLDDGRPLDGGDGCPGLPLGVAERVGCATSTAALDPDSGLLLYTDGLTEARRHTAGSADGLELFGEERVSKVISRLRRSTPIEIVRQLQEEVRSFADERLADDLCVIALRNSARRDSTQVC